MMLGYQNSFATQKRAFVRAEIVQDDRIIRRVRRVEKGDVPPDSVSSPGKILGRQRHDFSLGFRNLKQVKVFFDQSAGLPRFVDERNECCPARNGFYTDRPGTSAKVENSRFVVDSRCKYVEQRFSEAVGCRPRSVAGRALNNTTAVFSGYDSHKKEKVRKPFLDNSTMDRGATPRRSVIQFVFRS